MPGTILGAGAFDYDDNRPQNRITPTWDDVFARMTDQQSTEFKGRVESLKGWLDEAERTGATAPLRKAFGSDFPE